MVNAINILTSTENWTSSSALALLHDYKLSPVDLVFCHYKSFELSPTQFCLLRYELLIMLKQGNHDKTRRQILSVRVKSHISSLKGLESTYKI